MNKNIAIPMENGILCSHFGHCEYFALVNIENNEIAGVQEIVPPEHQPGVYPRWIAGLNATDVIAGGMGQKAINLFLAEEINVFTGAPLRSAKEIVEDFLADKPTLGANYCNHDDKSNCNHH